MRAVLEQRDDAAFAADAFVAQELGLVFELHAAAQVDAELAGRLRLLALRFHRGLEARLIDGEAALARDVGREIDRESRRCRRA